MTSKDRHEIDLGRLATNILNGRHSTLGAATDVCGSEVDADGGVAAAGGPET